MALFLLVTLLPLSAQGQSSQNWITETSLTWGRGGPAYQGPGSDAVALVDLGRRWSYPPGTGWGVSFAGGYDFPNEASLVGGRVRLTRELAQGRLEGSLAAVASSVGDGGMGGIVGLAFYPRPWGALVVQLDLVPTAPPENYCSHRTEYDPYDPLCDGVTDDPTRDPTVTFGFKAAEHVGLYTWMGAAGIGLLAFLLKDAELGCC